MELDFVGLTADDMITAVAFPAYMYSVAKLQKILHIPTLFANYLMDSLLFSLFEDSTLT